MPISLDDKLVVAISSRALFNLEEENRLFDAGDDKAYMQLQFERLDVPAKPGEAIVTYLSGMGVTNPVVASGQTAPLTVLLPAVIQPTVTVDGQPAAIAFAGLTPGGIGLFQINFTVPAGARAGDLDVVIVQNGIKANVTKLPVAAN